MKKKLDKASVHNGRANSKGVAYNANHNTMELSREHQPHIDPDRIHLNRYIQYLDGGTAIAHMGGDTPDKVHWVCRLSRRKPTTAKNTTSPNIPCPRSLHLYMI